jgi:16S rRNA (adenine(1408)-N(1))-methyltransferase
MEAEEFWRLIAPFLGRIVVDLGTGDGLFAYRSALQNPGKFYIGLDANVRPLAQISERIYRRPAKGGAANVLYLQAAVEGLPPELDGIADEVHIHFPWGSLLKGIATGDEWILNNLRHLCRPGAQLEVVISVDPKHDRSELKRLGLPELSMRYLKSELVPKYESGGFEICDYGRHFSSGWPEIESSWAKRLRHSAMRVLIYIRARAT